MRRFRLIAIAAILALCGVLGACEPAAPPEISGNLYFGSGSYLARMALRNGSTEIVASIGNAEIQGISPKDGSRILLNVFGPVNQEDSHRLVLFDLETRQQFTLFEGRFGRYLVDGKILVYDDGAHIRATRKSADSWEKVEIARHPFNAAIRIVPVSATAFLYSIGPEPDAPLYLFDTAQGESVELEMLAGACTLDGAIWVQARSELLCRSNAAGAYALVRLDGAVSNTLQLPPDKTFRALAYMPDRDAVVFNESWRAWMSRRQKWAVWVYDIGDATAHRILEHQYLGQTVIYQPE